MEKFVEQQKCPWKKHPVQNSTAFSSLKPFCFFVLFKTIMVRKYSCKNLQIQL